MASRFARWMESPMVRIVLIGLGLLTILGLAALTEPPVLSAAPQRAPQTFSYVTAHQCTVKSGETPVSKPNKLLPAGYTWTRTCGEGLQRSGLILKGVKEDSVLEYSCSTSPSRRPLASGALFRWRYVCRKDGGDSNFRQAQFPVIVVPTVTIIPMSSSVFVLASEYPGLGISMGRTLANQLIRKITRGQINPRPCEFCQGAGWVERAIGSKEAGRISWEIQEIKCTTCGGSGWRNIRGTRSWWITASDKEHPEYRVHYQGRSFPLARQVRFVFRRVEPVQPGEIV